MRPAILVNDTEAFVACALAGMGMIQALRAGVVEHLVTGRLVEVLPQAAAIPRPVSVMYPNRQYLPAQVRAFIDWIGATFRMLEKTGAVLIALRHGDISGKWQDRPRRRSRLRDQSDRAKRSLTIHTSS